jgi:hypothetical protein
MTIVITNTDLLRHIIREELNSNVHGSSRVNAALDAASSVEGGLDGRDFVELALLCIDQAGASLSVQDKVIELLSDAGLM